ncbi:D-amino acid dehydrogenase [Zoogloea sp. 1C4]|uniref:D-amino acid dehydrogenase n=1 Tax=Zoogloea sp. 1C4 TaxID=2570190 RepID=UPI001291544B|nr:D-amino acid dehydrogenase [Zoogloea sp. 1C4]
MEVLVIGAGLAGVTSAWYLAQAGCRVTVIDRRPGPGMETSFANGGQISVSHPEPWANPAAPATVLRWLGRSDAPLLFRWRADAAQWRWAFSFLRECLPGRTARNTAAIANLAVYSRNELRALREATGIEYEAGTGGILHLFETRRELAHLPAKLHQLEKLGIHGRILDPDEAISLEPALSGLRPRLAGVLHGLDDETGNAHLFCTELAKRAEAAGVRFCLNSILQSFDTINGRITGVRVLDGARRAGVLRADAVVLAAGSYSPEIARPLGIRLPIYPVKGYSITAPILDPDRAPRLSLTDESRRIVCSRLGSHLRVAGTAELNGYNLEPNPARSAAIVKWIEDHLPGAADLGQAEHWCGLRPATPSNVPLIGRTRVDNLFLNTGHGTLGWTLACGSGQAISDIVTGRQPRPDFPFLLDKGR